MDSRVPTHAAWDGTAAVEDRGDDTARRGNVVDEVEVVEGAAVLVGRGEFN